MNEFSDAPYSLAVDEQRQRSRQRQANLESELAQNKARSDQADAEQRVQDQATAARRADRTPNMVEQVMGRKLKL
jgi:hypothetical protein